MKREAPGMSELAAEKIQRHTVLQSLILHLLPGLVMTLSFLVTVPLVRSAGLPTNIAFALITDLFIMIPMELGLLFYLARKRGNKGWSLRGIVVYDKYLPLLKILTWAFAILIPTAIIFAVFQPLTDWQRGAFDWLPESLLVSENGYGGEFSQGVLIFTLVTNFIFTVIVAPIVEELYFRGYLLPRMPERFGKGAPIIHSLMFSVYHLWTPWMYLVRTFGLLPLIYVTKWTKSILPGSIAHMLANSVDVITIAVDRLR